MKKITLLKGDCLDKLKELKDNSIDSVVTDPPYGIGFMNKEWDSPKKHKELIEREQKRSEKRYKEGKSPAKGTFSKGVQPGLPIGGAKEGKWFEEWTEEWAKEAYRVLKPGGYVLSFCAPRMYHRMASGIEDAGFQIRDQIMWVFGSGFPKSHNLGKYIHKLKTDGSCREVVNKGVGNTNGKFFKAGKHHSGQEVDSTEDEQWKGWGTALKPAHEPIVMARKPLSEKTVAKNVLKHGTGGINIDGCRIGTEGGTTRSHQAPTGDSGWRVGHNVVELNEGRFPANIIFDEESGNEEWKRYFYCPKASKKDRNEGNTTNQHPTVKPTDLMAYLVRLVTPKGGTVLDPFMGSGSTGKASVREGFDFIGIERENEYMEIAKTRIEYEQKKNKHQDFFDYE